MILKDVTMVTNEGPILGKPVDDKYVFFSLGMSELLIWDYLK